MVKQILSDYPDIQGAVLLIDYDPALKNSGLAGCYMMSQKEEFSDMQRFHSMCLHGASAVNAQVMRDCVELYRTTQTEGETEDDS